MGNALARVHLRPSKLKETCCAAGFSALPVETWLDCDGSPCVSTAAALLEADSVGFAVALEAPKLIDEILFAAEEAGFAAPLAYKDADEADIPALLEASATLPTCSEVAS